MFILRGMDNTPASTPPPLIFREVDLTADTAGKLFLHSMPGRYEPWPVFTAAANACLIQLVVSLTSAVEIAGKAPAYADALDQGAFPFARLEIPMPDFGVPASAEQFAIAVEDTSRTLRNGENVLIHCGAGIGRTGTFAVCVLGELGYRLEDALAQINNAGAGPEVEPQLDWIYRWFQTATE